uniref:Poly [ADP-ribose] polymerase n=1 Tax=Brassica oleracea var. oleracea TaxID=109376 RepID=A0A0D3ASC1_BRAOL
MANKLKVNELRAKLAERGLITTGLKPVLVERLEEAIAQDAKKVKSKSRRKRNRDSSDSTHDSNKLIAIGEFRAMNVKELRKEASKRGLATTGTKKELLERLCNDEAQDDKNGLEEEKSTKKGAAVLDQWIPDHVKSEYHGDDVYDAMLNQTNVRDNNNKFFVLQVLASDNKKTYMVHFRWGRVGVKGQSKLDGPYDSCDPAIEIFSNKFYDKTRNHWSDRKEFIFHPKSYAWLEVDYGKEENDSVLKVNELRAKLAERGLITTGLKPVLVERLEEAIAQDAKKVKSKSRRKRNRDSSDSTHDSNKLIAIGEFRAMNVKELRKEASKRGLATTGTKKELLERLCNDEAQDDKNGLEEEKSTKKGAAVLDQWIPDHVKSEYHGDDVYDAMLNQTNVRDNNNKFFVLQVLASDNKKTYMVHFRWGRVGVKGQSKLDGPYDSCDPAIEIFSNKFYDKTRNHWSDRKEFIFHPKSYAWLEVDYGKEENDSVRVLEAEYFCVIND